MAKLKLIKDGIEVHSLDLDKLDKTSIILGRAEGCDIRLDDRNIGREHAVFSVQGSKVSVHKKSKYGKLSVNGVESEDARIQSGDIVYIADYRLEVEGAIQKHSTEIPKKIQTKLASDLNSEKSNLIIPSELPMTELPPIDEQKSELQLSDSKDLSPDLELPIDMQNIDSAVEPILDVDKNMEAQASSDVPFDLNDQPIDLKLETNPVQEVVKSGDILMPLDSGGALSLEENSSDKKTKISGLNPVEGSFKLEVPPIELQQPADVNASDKTKQTSQATQTKQVTRTVASKGFQINTGTQITNGDKTKIESINHMEVKLVFNQGDANVQEFIIDKPMISIGKGTDCDVELNDKSVSRKHAVIKNVGARYYLVDQGSINGTFVNGEKISEHELSSDDVIQIGSIEFQFQALDLNYSQQKSKFMRMPEDPVNEDIQRDSFYQSNSRQAHNPNIDFAGAIPLGIKTPEKKESKSLLNKLPKPVRMIVVAVIAIIASLVLFTDSSKPKKSTKTGVVSKENVAFEKLPAEKKQFVINTYQLAMDLYKNQEFERALFEINKVLEILPQGYKDALDLKSYAEKAIEIEKSKEDEKKRKEEQAKVAQQVADLLVQLEQLVKDKKELAAKEVLSQIFELDPENAAALRLKQELDELLQKTKMDEEERMNQEEKRRILQNLIEEGKALFKKGRYYEVIDKMITAPDTGSTDQKLLNKAAQLIKQSKQALKNKVRPHLDAASAAMQAEDYPKARDEYYKALKIDYKNSEAKAGLVKIREILHRRSQQIFTQAIMAESVSDFETARGLFRECLVQSMPDDVYYGRCFRKLERYRVLDKGDQSSEQRQVASESGTVKGVGSDPEMPKFDSNGGSQ